jgi:hypothetical protein
MPCLTAITSLNSWTPGPGTDPLRVIIGTCACAPAAYAHSLWVVQKEKIVVHGGLTANTIKTFRTSIDSKASQLVKVEHDLRPKRIIVPCPPPNLTFTTADLGRLDAALKAPVADSNLGSVFGALVGAFARKRKDAA